VSIPTNTDEETALDVLSDFGLTAKESEVYVLLCKKGPLKGLDVSKSLGMHKGEIYRVLKSLQRREIVESIIESPNVSQRSPLNSF
jgi:sugar-specific transcriptional regulator TrmB